MTKHAFTTQMCAHVWAQRSQDSGYTSGGSLKFDYDVLTAYSTVVAILVDGADGRTYAIHKNHVRRSGFAPNYGSIARRASSQYESLSVEDLDTFYYTRHEILRFDDESVALRLRELLTGLVAAFSNAVKTALNVNANKWQDESRRCEYVREASYAVTKFAKAFALTEPAELEQETIDACDAIHKAIAERDAKANDPKRIERAARSKASKEKRQERFDAEFYNWNEHGMKRPPWSAFNASISALDARSVKKALENDERDFRWQRNDCAGARIPYAAWQFMRPVRKHEKRIKNAHEIIAGFKRGGFTWRYTDENVSKALSLLWRETQENDRQAIVEGVARAKLEKEINATFAALNPEAEKVVIERERARYMHGQPAPITVDEWVNGKGEGYQYFDGVTHVRRKGNRLETSQGAESPFALAVAAFLKAQECRINGTPWMKNGERLPVGHFEVDKIESDGTLCAGCHRIAWEQMLALACREIPHLIKNRYPLPALAA